MSKSIRDKIGFTPTRFDLDGDDQVCKWYLPVAKSAAKDFIKRTEGAGLKQCGFTLTFYNPYAQVRFRYYYGRLEVLITTVPEGMPKPIRKKVEEGVQFVLLCGDEEVGYNVATFSAGGGITLLRFETMSQIMASFPVTRHDQAHRYRYSYVSDTHLGAVTEGEPIISAYVENAAKGGQYGVFAVPPTNAAIAGERCLPPNFLLETPFNSGAFDTLVPATRCNTPSSDLMNTLETFGYYNIQIGWEMQYTPRVFILAQTPPPPEIDAGTTMFDKRDVVLSVDGAASITGINTHAWVLKGSSAINTIKNKSIYAVSAARHGKFKFSNNMFYTTEEATYYGQYMGLFVVQKADTPAGPLLILNDDNLVERVWTLVESFFGFTPNYLGCQDAERFIPTFDNDFFDEVDAANTAYKQTTITDEVARSYYSFSFPNIVFPGITHVCPMTEAPDVFVGLPVTGMFAEVTGSGGHRPNATCAKNIAQSIIVDGIQLDIYFSTFMEATYTYSSQNSRWDPVESRQVFMGAAKRGGEKFDILQQIKTAFAQFRAADLLASRVPLLGPHPCAGAAMLYPTKRGENFFSEALDCFNLINEYRVTRGAPKLKWDGTLTTAAATHAQDIATTLAVDHEGSDGAQSWNRIMASGVSGWCEQVSTYGEIIAIGQETAAEAIASWKLSTQGHHEALYTKRHIACGIATSVDTVGNKVWVVTFAGDYTLDTI